MALQGNIDSFPLLEVLGLLSQSKKSGRLVVNADRCNAIVWLDGGEIVGAASGPISMAPSDCDPVDALFDLLRAERGDFVFEQGQGCANPIEAVSTDVVIKHAQAALEEWSQITATLPDTTTALSLTASLGEREVTIDDRLWGGLVALMSVAVRDNGVVDARAFHELLGLGELDSLRLGYDLIEAGLIELAPEAPEDRRSGAIGGEGSHPLRSTIAHGGGGADTAAGPGAAPIVVPNAADAMGLPSLHLPPAGSQGPMHPALALAPTPPVLAPAISREVPFDAVATALYGDGVAHGQASNPTIVPAPVVQRNVTPTAGDPDAELARQLAMLSPRAAEAVAGADATGGHEDPSGPRVARFFDTA